MDIIVNVFAGFGAFVFVGLFGLIIWEIIVERGRNYCVNNYLSDKEIAEYLQHDEEMIRIRSLALTREKDKHSA